MQLSFRLLFIVLIWAYMHPCKCSDAIIPTSELAKIKPDLQLPLTISAESLLEACTKRLDGHLSDRVRSHLLHLRGNCYRLRGMNELATTDLKQAYVLNDQNPAPLIAMCEINMFSSNRGTSEDAITLMLTIGDRYPKKLCISVRICTYATCSR